MPSVEQKRLQTSLILRCHSKVIKILGKITDIKSDGRVQNLIFIPICAYIRIFLMSSSHTFSDILNEI